MLFCASICLQGYNSNMCLCERCNKPYTPTRGRTGQRFCSPKCRIATSNDNKPLTGREGLTTGTIGAMHELAVAIDLMKRGFHVFRALSPSCSCDLIVLTDTDMCIRVEVSTGYVNRSGKITSTKYSVPKRWDLLAIVCPDGIYYLDDSAGIIAPQ